MMRRRFWRRRRDEKEKENHKGEEEKEEKEEEEVVEVGKAHPESRRRGDIVMVHADVNMRTEKLLETALIIRQGGVVFSRNWLIVGPHINADDRSI